MKAAARKTEGAPKRNPAWLNVEPHKWVKGKSGNPAGRRRLTAAERLERTERKRLAREVALRQLDIVVLTREHADLAVSVLASVAATSAEDDVRVRAAAELLSRGFGKPIEQVVSLNADISPSADRQARAAVALERLKSIMLGSQMPVGDAGRVLDHADTPKHDTALERS